MRFLRGVHAAPFVLVFAAAIALPSESAPASTERWSALAPSLVPRTEVSSAAVGRDIYVVGGYTYGSARTRNVERFDTGRDRWSLVRPMPVALNHAAAVAYDGDLYVVGGYTGTPFSLGIGTGGGVAEASRQFFRYDPETNRWSIMPPAPTARAATAAGVMGDKLYVAGGADSLRPLTRFEIYDFKRRRWTIGPKLPRATEHTAGAALGGAFYVIAGRPFYGGGTNRFVQRYLPRERRWERVADVRKGRAGFAAVAVCDSIVIYGGEDPGKSSTGTVEETERYDPRSNVWSRLPDMRTPRHGLGGAVVGRRVYALEGGPVTLVAISNTAEALDVACRKRPGARPSHAKPPPPMCTARGTSRNDVIRGTPGDDVICAGAGNDIIYGLDGNDDLRGGDGADTLRGGYGNDRLSGGDGDDQVVGGDGADRLTGGSGKDDVTGQAGNDFLDARDGVRGNDVANGGADPDSCSTDPRDVRTSC